MFKDILNDKVTLVKKDGTVQKSDIPAQVQSKFILITDVSLPIEVGDRILRHLPSSLAEEYIIDNPKYFAGLPGMDAHFQLEVHRSDAPQASPQTIINNIQGDNAKVNINSTDNSHNIYLQSDNSALFNEMHTLLNASALSEVDKSKIQQAIIDMEHADSPNSLRESYKNFMASAATHVTVFAPILGALATAMI